MIVVGMTLRAGSVASAVIDRFLALAAECVVGIRVGVRALQSEPSSKTSEVSCETSAVVTGAADLAAAEVEARPAAAIAPNSTLLLLAASNERSATCSKSNRPRSAATGFRSPTFSRARSSRRQRRRQIANRIDRDVEIGAADDVAVAIDDFNRHAERNRISALRYRAEARDCEVIATDVLDLECFISWFRRAPKFSWQYRGCP